MRKILITLIGLLLLGVFFFVQTKEKKKQDFIRENRPKKILNHTTHNTAPKKENNIATKGVAEKAKPKSEKELKKEILADIQLRMTDRIQTISSCLENAQNKQEALSCNNELQELNKELKLISDIDQDIDTQQKTKMIQEIDSSIQPLRDMLSCIQEAQTDAQLGKCHDVK